MGWGAFHNRKLGGWKHDFKMHASHWLRFLFGLGLAFLFSPRPQIKTCRTSPTTLDKSHRPWSVPEPSQGRPKLHYKRVCCAEGIASLHMTSFLIFPNFWTRWGARPWRQFLEAPRLTPPGLACDSHNICTARSHCKAWPARPRASPLYMTCTTQGIGGH